MNSNEREELLIHKLRNEQSFITVAKIAAELSLSNKTIYRLINRINQTAGQELIETAKGKGIRLNYNTYLESQYKQNTPEDNNTIRYNFSPVERRLHIIKELLFHAPLTMRERELFAPYYLSPSAIYTDEELMSRLLSQYNLKLKKNNNRLGIAGEEQQIRKALIHLLTKLNLLNFDDISANIQEFNQNDLRFARCQLELIEQEIDSIIPAPYNINILTHLYILIRRAGKSDFTQESVPLPPSPYLSIAEKIRKNIEGYLCTSLPDSETANIVRFLSGSHMTDTPDLLPLSTEAHKLTDFFIQEFSHLEHIPLPNELYNDVLNHIAPMLHRLKNGLLVANPLLDDIVQEYNNIYQHVRHIATAATKQFHLPSLSDDEVGFITLYFARYWEQHPQNFRVLIICTTGLGTSELLRAKVSRFFPELDIVGAASIKNVTPAYLAEENIDLILTTVKLKENFPVPTLLVNTLFIDRDKENVRQILKMHHCKSTNVEAIVPIFTINHVPNKQNLFRLLLKDAPFELRQQQTAIIHALHERERLGDTCIAPHIALAHAQLTEVTVPYVAVAILKQPLIWDRENNTVQLIIMILLPMIPAANAIHKLHELMHKLADDELTAKLADDPTPANIKKYLFTH